LNEKEGEIVTEDGAVVGAKRRAQFHHRPAQRTRICRRQPLYVLEIDPERNRVVVGDDEALRTTSFEVTGTNWVSIAAPTSPRQASVKNSPQARTRIRQSSKP